MKEMSAEALVSKARNELSMELPVFGSLTLRLLKKEVTKEQLHGHDTMGTDGLHMFYTRSFVERTAAWDKAAKRYAGLPDLVGTVLHETLHPTFGHHWRMLDVPQDWKVLLACDFEINPIARDALAEANRKSGYTVGKLPNEAAMPGNKPFNFPERLTAEKYYKLLTQWERQNPDKVPQAKQVALVGTCGEAGCMPMPGSGEGDGEGEGKDGGLGKGEGKQEGKLPNRPSRAEISAEQMKWQQAIEQAVSVGRMAGSVPAGLEILLGEIHKPAVNYRDQLARWLTDRSSEDYRMFPPSRKYAALGHWMPSLRSEDQMGVVVFAVDMSGSTGLAGTRERFIAEASGAIEEVSPREAVLMPFESHVGRVSKYGRGDYPLTLADWKLSGGGGTSFFPVFDYIRENDIEPACVIVFTDMYGDGWPSEEQCPWPLLWVACGSEVVAPIGETIHVPAVECGA